MLFFFACRAPEAPQEYEELVSFLFQEMDNPDQDFPKAGIENLSEWLQGEESSLVEEGVQIASLDLHVLDGLEGEGYGGQELSGVSIITGSKYEPEVISDALTQYSFADMMPDVYEVYDRSFSEGQDCIVEKDCLWAEAEAYTVADWGLLGKVEANRKIQFRWIETDVGSVFLQRWWLQEPSTGTSMGLVIHNQYYIGATIPSESGSIRMHASWLSMELSTGDASQGAANQLISNWKKDAEALDEWIAEQE